MGFLSPPKPPPPPKPIPPKQQATQEEAEKVAGMKEKRRRGNSDYDKSIRAGGAVNPAYTTGTKVYQGQ